MYYHIKLADMPKENQTIFESYHKQACPMAELSVNKNQYGTEAVIKVVYPDLTSCADVNNLIAGKSWLIQASDTNDIFKGLVNTLDWTGEIE